MIALTDRQKDSFTSSSILRCLTDIFMEKWNSFNCAGITTEEELLKRIKGQLFND
jgi:hypothetical protein